MSRTNSLHRFSLIAGTVISTAAIVSCSGGGGKPTPPAPEYLVASIPEFYFGTRDVGTAATQQIVLSNRSADIYPLHSLELHGVNAEEFETNFIGDITLNPTESISIDVTFVPITDGQKIASLDVKYDIIEQATPEQNANEQNFYQAADLESEGKFEESSQAYRSYLQGKPVTSNKTRAALKVPMLNESENHGDGPDFKTYLQAVNQRDSNNYDGALTSIDKLLREQPDSYLADDALYMRGYIELMDKADYRAAKESMSRLREQHPDTEYYDTALFSEALANDELGEKTSANGLYQSLKDRHTSEGAKMLSLDLPKDNFMSRLWFDRAKQGLERSS